MTAFTTGTIMPSGAEEGHDLLLTVLKTFLTTNATLVAANEAWVVEKEETISTYTISGISGSQIYTGSFRDLYLRGPGLSQTDNIYVNLRAYQNSPTNMYNWMMAGATGFDTLEAWEDQPNISLVSSHFSYFALTDSVIDYTFVADGRRFIIAVTIEGDTYLSYCGFILPYAIPSEYPYPLAIIGTTNSVETIISSSNCRNFWGASAIRCSMRLDSGVWQALGLTVGSQLIVWPWDDAATTNFQLRGNLDGSYTLLPAVIYTDSNGGNVYGELDGIFYVPKTGETDLAAEDTITIDTVEYLVLQNGQRLEEYEYGVIRKS